jgi:hypothetical protein
MKRIFQIMFLVQSILFVACPAIFAADSLAAYPGVPEIAGPAAEKKVAVRFKEISLPSYLKFVSRETGLNFRLTDGLGAITVTIFAKDAPVTALLELLIKTKGLKFRRNPKDGFYIVTQDEKAAVFPPLTRKDMEDLQVRQAGPVRLNKASLTTLLDVVSSQSRVNFIITKEVTEKTITVYLTRTSVADIIQLLGSKGYEFSRLTGTYTLLVRFSDAAATKLTEAQKAYDEKKYEVSAALYGELYAKTPDSYIADYALLMSAVSYDWLAGRDGSAKALRAEEETLLKLIKAYPSSTRLGDAYLYLGNIHSGNAGLAPEKIDCKKAIRYYDLAMKDTYRPWVKAQSMVRTGQCHALAGDEKKAREIYAEAAKKYPDEAIVKAFLPDGQKAMLEIAIRLEEMGEYELALKVYEAVQKKDSAPETSAELKLRLEACRRRAAAR